MILFNPVIDNGPGGYRYERIGDNYKNFSPLHNLSGKLPPTIIFLGKADKLIPVVTMKYYKLVMEKLNFICELNLYDNVGHGFFNYSEEDQKYYRDTLLKAEKFLIDQGFMK